MTQSERKIRYVVVGAICAAIHNAIMIGGDWLGAHYLPMNFVSFAVVTPVGYWLHSDFTFRGALSFRGFLRFAAGVAAGFRASRLAEWQREMLLLDILPTSNSQLNGVCYAAELEEDQ